MWKSYNMSISDTQELEEQSSGDIVSVSSFRLALLGAPNCGKTSLFNALTGGKAKVANYPGVTVEYRIGHFALPNGQDTELLDLPGVYGDCGHSMDERVALDAVRGKLEGQRAPDAIVFMMDASHISTHLHNVIQAKQHNLPMVLVLNMMDMAARDGMTIDIPALEAKLGVPVISCVAVRASGRGQLLQFLSEWSPAVLSGEALKPIAETKVLKDLQAQARTITSQTVDTLMSKIGLNGRAFIPLLSSFACAIPGVMAARTIEQERDRITTIMIAPLMTCAARWPVYLLIIGAFIPNETVGLFRLQGLVAFGLVITGVLFAMIMAFIFKKTLTRGESSGLLIELPS